MQPFRLLSLRPLALILFTGLAAPAYADIYKCTDTDGRVTYTNDRSLGRGCVRLQSDQPRVLDPLASTPPLRRCACDRLLRRLPAG